MQITFLIGNGFDIGLGMKSRFSDFFPVYIQQAEGKEKTLKDFAKEIDEHCEEWSYFEEQLGKYSSKFTMDNKDVMREQVTDFSVQFTQYLSEEEEKLNFDDDKINSIMAKALVNFYSLDKLAKGAHEAVTETMKKNPSHSRMYNFLSFNYTECLEKCLAHFNERIVQQRNVAGIEVKDCIGEILHIHGKVNECPIMGVNDKSQIENESLAEDEEFTSLFVKPEANFELKTQAERDGRQVIDNSDIICVYGMSLGKTDKLWWKKLIEWLNKDVKHQLVIFLYDGKSSEKTQFGIINRRRRTLSTLREYSEYQADDFDKLRQRIHFAINKNIFEMPLRIPEKKNESKEKAKTSDDYSMHTLSDIIRYYEMPKCDYDDILKKETEELRELLDKPVVSLEDEIKKWAQ